MHTHIMVTEWVPHDHRAILGAADEESLWCTTLVPHQARDAAFMGPQQGSLRRKAGKHKGEGEGGQ